MMRPTPDDGEWGSKLETLRVTLEAATTLAGELGGDPQVARLLEAFATLPPADREVIAGVIEHEARARQLSQAAQEITGWTLHPNPHAQLYLRSQSPPLTRFELERENITRVMLRVLRAAPMLMTPEIFAAFETAAREAIAQLEPPTRAVVATLFRVLQGLLADAGEPRPAAPLSLSGDSR